MPPSGLEVPPHAVARNPLPFQSRDQIAWNFVEVPQKESERVAGIICIGTATAPLEDRPRPDPQAFLTRWVKA